MSRPSPLRRPRATADAQASPPALTRSPQPFDVVDEVASYLDKPGEPNNIHLELRLPGPLDERAFRAAVSQAITGLPRAGARRSARSSWRPRSVWEFPDQLDCDPVSFGTWPDKAGLDRLRESFMASAPSLSAAPPLRLLVAEGPAECCVILNAHHAALDGISDIEFMRRVAAGYHQPDQPASPQRSEPADGPGPAGQNGSPSVAARSTRRMPSARRPAAGRNVTRIAAEPGADPAGDGFQLLPLRPVRALRKGRPGAPVTVNDVLIAAHILTIWRWNTAHGWPASNIRVTIPINTRPPGQDRTAGNLTRLATITVKLPPGTEPATAGLLTEVARQTQWSKDHPGPEADPLSRLLVVAWLPRSVKRLALRTLLRVAGPYICDTSLVTNLGNVADPPRFGKHAITRMAITAPAHMPRGLSVSAITVDGRFQLCVRFRYALLSRAAAAEFAGLYGATVDELTAAANAVAVSAESLAVP